MMDKETYMQLDRIEAKLDVLMYLENIELDQDGIPIIPEENQNEQEETRQEGKYKEIEKEE